MPIQPKSFADTPSGGSTTTSQFYLEGPPSRLNPKATKYPTTSALAERCNQLHGGFPLTSAQYWHILFTEDSVRTMTCPEARELLSQAHRDLQDPEYSEGYNGRIDYLCTLPGNIHTVYTSPSLRTLAYKRHVDGKGECEASVIYLLREGTKWRLGIVLGGYERSTIISGSHEHILAHFKDIPELEMSDYSG